MTNPLDASDSLPLRRRFDSDISLDRFSEKSLHGLDFDDRTCSKFLTKLQIITRSLEVIAILNYNLI